MFGAQACYTGSAVTDTFKRVTVSVSPFTQFSHSYLTDVTSEGALLLIGKREWGGFLMIKHNSQYSSHKLLLV